MVLGDHVGMSVVGLQAHILLTGNVVVATYLSLSSEQNTSYLYGNNVLTNPGSTARPGGFDQAVQLGVRTPHCVRPFCIIDTLTKASMLLRVDVIIHEASSAIARAGHVFIGNMS